LFNGDFETVNELLELIPANAYDTDILIGFLTITVSAKDCLPARSDFLEKVKRIAAIRGDIEEDLFLGLD